MSSNESEAHVIFKHHLDLNKVPDENESPLNESAKVKEAMESVNSLCQKIVQPNHKVQNLHHNIWIIFRVVE